MAELNPELYTVAWIAPLEIEAQAALHMLDHKHQGYFPSSRGDDYVFQAGDICGHNVVIATLPSGQEYGTGSAAALASQLKKVFPNLWFGLLVGVAAGLPDLTRNPPRDIRLGDVLVGIATNENPGIVPYDLGKETATGYQLLREGQYLMNTETVVRSAIGAIKMKAPNDAAVLLPHYEGIKDKWHSTGTFIDPGQEQDCLYEVENGSSRLVQRELRAGSYRTRVWYGPIGSGNKVIKSYQKRNELRDKYGLIGLEMEAAGVMNYIPVGVIRGVCDYGDEQKTKQWQPYASAMAAAFSKAVLHEIPLMKKKVADSFKTPFTLPRLPVVGHFVDRPSDMEDIEKALLPTENCPRRKILVLGGIGGIGKTQLAIEFARRYQTRFTSVFWLDGKTEESLKQSIADCARQIPAGQIVQASTLDFSKQKDNIDQDIKNVLGWLGRPENTKWLLIFDNVDRDYRSQGIDPHAYDVRYYFPRSDHGSILITSRFAPLSQLGIFKVMKPVTGHEARAIFQTRYGRDFGDSQSDELFQLLGGLPLALAQAGAYMRESGVDFSTYTEFYKSQWDELAQQSDSDVPLMDYPGRSIWTTWTVSYQAIKARNLSAANLLLLWAWLDNRDLWHELLIAASAMEGTSLPKWLLDIAADRLEYTKAVRLLLNYGLLERVEGADAFAIHPVIHRWTLSAQQGEQRIEMGRLAVLVVGCCNAGSETASWIFERRLLNHALHCSELIVTDTANIIVWEYRDQVLLLAASNIGALLQEHGRANAAERICKCALSEYEKNPDRGNILMTLNLLNIIGAVYYRQGKLDMAEKTWERVLQGQMQKVGIRHLGTLQTINNLGIVYMEQGKLDDAEGKYLLALQERKKLFDKDHPSVLDVIHNMGALYQIRGKLAEAAQMFKQAFEGKKKTLGLEHHSTLRAAGLLSILYQRLGKLDAAKEIFLQELQAYETRDGLEGTETLRTLYNLGCVYMDLNDVSQAQIMYQRALKGLEKGPLASHTLALDTLNNLGIIYMKQGRSNLAEETLMRALREKEKILGPTHKSTIDTVHNLDKVHRLQGRTRETRIFPQPEQLWIQKLRLQQEVDEEVDEIISQSMATENLRNATLEATKALQNVHTRLYVQVEVNGKSVPAVVRTGAQVTLMSAEYASQCNITRLIDRRYNGIIEGVGAETLIGRVHSVQIKVGNIFRACSLTIIAGNHIGLHLGLDILQRYQASIDLRRNVLVIQNQAIRFLSEDEIPKGFEDE